MLRLHESVQVPCVFLKLLSISCLRWCWWWYCCCWWRRRRRRVFIFSTGSPQFPTSSQGRTDARYLEKFAGCLAVPPWGFPPISQERVLGNCLENLWFVWKAEGVNLDTHHCSTMRILPKTWEFLPAICYQSARYWYRLMLNIPS